jgi:epoxyqueuosine reductase
LEREDGQDTHGWLYGCDECQSACPYNKSAPMCKCPDLLAGLQHSYAPLLGETASLDAEAFGLRYGYTAIAWAGVATLAENARRLIARGNGPSGG